MRRSKGATSARILLRRIESASERMGSQSRTNLYFLLFLWWVVSVGWKGCLGDGRLIIGPRYTYMYTSCPSHATYFLRVSTELSAEMKAVGKVKASVMDSVRRCPMAVRR